MIDRPKMTDGLVLLVSLVMLSVLASATPIVANGASCRQNCTDSYGVCEKGATQLYKSRNSDCKHDRTVWRSNCDEIYQHDLGECADGDTTCRDNVASERQACYGDAGREYTHCWTWANGLLDLDVKQCETEQTICRQDCDDNYGPPPSGGGGNGMTLDDNCPFGTQPDELGRCTIRLESNGTVDLDPRDHCPAGSVPGPDDACVPQISMVRVTSLGDGDGWIVTCPPGTEPGPVDGCVPYIPGQPIIQGDLVPERCPPGSVPGPDDACVPQTQTEDWALEQFDLLRQRRDALVAVDDETIEVIEILALQLHNARVTHDLAGALARTAEALGASPVD